MSLFGLDFTMQASWLIDFNNGITEDETFTIAHTTTSFTASHQLSGDTISATLQAESNANQAEYTIEASS